MSAAPLPVEICLHAVSKTLEVGFDDGRRFSLPAEYLRVRSPSAEVRGHGVGNEILQTGKRGVAILSVEQVGHYALRLVFDDGHRNGLYTWEYLYELGTRQSEYWQAYLTRLDEAGASRDPDPSAFS
ncbi:gamma-butyrobetaine hydroxylase-like domain-containing protein [Paludibacterium paludis]|uniref:1-(5-phosphoribosyl)-5-((5-phosphoribosylamino) methylideneamino)imidazole-4-carboxamide isomerase n=1 Tax=Paludibacterium paludis TaxID=1225769 RepID=A0A918NWD5_9NEIS|nr:DUF971 domain-containing protein [Paludibacterium paludis]GGY02088.1 1-(5-phosphoribosyl)-5-((5-phosphoribosylamino) methylideneamino)imidazole-4-carboxamide isomerase [Paludibacterium paludis]